MNTTIDAHMPRPYRDSMVHVLTKCLYLLADDGQSVSALCKHVHKSLQALRTEDYEEYCERWLLNKESRIMSLNEWREAVADLHEAIQLAEIFDQEPGPEATALRRRLLLENDELPAIHGDRADHSTQGRDGMLDGYWEVQEIIEEAVNRHEDLLPQELGARISQCLFAAWPADYLDYRKRHHAFFRERECPAAISPAMDYAEWCAYVDRLHALAAHCRTNGIAPESSAEYQDMLVRLLRASGERPPVVD